MNSTFIGHFESLESYLLNLLLEQFCLQERSDAPFKPSRKRVNKPISVSLMKISYVVSRQLLFSETTKSHQNPYLRAHPYFSSGGAPPANQLGASYLQGASCISRCKPSSVQGLARAKSSSNSIPKPGLVGVTI